MHVVERIYRAGVLAAALLVGTGQTPAPPMHADFLISAGHEGRPESCARFPLRRCNLGAPQEREWTPIVADEATQRLREDGYSVVRQPADFYGLFQVRAAVFLHFDGSPQPCASGASIGYHTEASARAAQLWRSMYSRDFPFRFQPDNFTKNLRDYYGFRQVQASEGALVLEFGEVTCPEQRAWLAPRLAFLGQRVAEFLEQLVVLEP